MKILYCCLRIKKMVNYLVYLFEKYKQKLLTILLSKVCEDYFDLFNYYIQVFINLFHRFLNKNFINHVLNMKYLIISYLLHKVILSPLTMYIHHLMSNCL